jgi:probable phosphoglycerate mutase
MSINFFIFRHGQTDWNKEQRLQGRANIALNSTGQAQARALIPILQPKSIDLLMASSLQRAVQTATIVGEALGIPVQTDSRLVEIDFGIADDGVTFQDYIAEHGEDYFQRVFRSVADADLDIPEDGETKRQAQTRVMDALADIAEHTQAKTIGMACHGFIMTLIAGRVSAGTLYRFDNCDVLHIRYDSGKWQFVNVYQK